MLSRRHLLLAPLMLEGQLRLEARQITSGPKHHFFGYIGHVQNIPWNAGDRYIVALETTFQERMPRASDSANLILLDSRANYKAEILDQTRAWNFQQGTMLYWNPGAPETQFFFNDRDPKTNRVYTVLYDVSRRKRVREYRFDDTPIGNSGVAQRGGWFYALNYARMARLRPVTGYPETSDWAPQEAQPDSDGVFRVDIETGKKRLLISFRRLASLLKTEKPLFINHTLANRENDRVFFFVRGGWDSGDSRGRVNAPFTMWPDGSHLTPQEFIGGHPEWDLGYRMLGQQGDRQVVYDTESRKVVGSLGTPDVFPVPGADIALSPDGATLVNGYRKNSDNFYTVYRRNGGAWGRSRGFNIEGYVSGDLRNDPAPCWNRKGDRFLFPAFARDGTRQLWIMSIV